MEQHFITNSTDYIDNTKVFYLALTTGGYLAITVKDHSIMDTKETEVLPPQSKGVFISDKVQLLALLNESLIHSTILH